MSSRKKGSRVPKTSSDESTDLSRQAEIADDDRAERDAPKNRGSPAAHWIHTAVRVVQALTMILALTTAWLAGSEYVRVIRVAVECTNIAVLWTLFGAALLHLYKGVDAQEERVALVSSCL